MPAVRRNEGSALITVIAVMAVMMIVSLTVVSVTLSSLHVTRSTLGGVQAQAAADGGIDDTAAKLATSSCEEGAAYASTTTPQFSVTISYSLQEDGGDWLPGCAVVGAKRIKLVSTGTAQAAIGQENQETRKVEAIYQSAGTAIGDRISIRDLGNK